MLKIRVNQGRQFSYSEHSGVIEIDGKSTGLDIVKIDKNRYHILRRGVSYNAELVSVSSPKSMVIKVEGEEFEVQISGSLDLLLEKLGMKKDPSGLLGNIISPMPGLVVEVMVNAGAKISKGSPLLVLQAMKMENIIKSPGDAVIKSVRVKKGDKVEKGQVLVELETG